MTIRIILLLWAYVSFAQQKSIEFYHPDEFVELVNDIKYTTKAQAKTYKKTPFAKEKKTALKQIHHYFKVVSTDSVYIHQTYFEEKIKRVLDRIYQVNPQLQHPNNKILLNRFFTPNAASYGIHLFEVNLGLFTLIENDDELAFVLCHEMAHQQLGHFEEKIEANNTLIQSESLKEETALLKQQQGSKSSQAAKILKGLALEMTEKSKETEIEADSLGLIYFQKTNYQLNAPTTFLKKIGTLEERIFSHKIDWKKTFGSPFKGYINQNIMFKNRLIDKEFKINKDSLRTHPNTELRIKKLNSSEANQTRKVVLSLDQIKAYEAIGDLPFDLVKPFYIYTFLHQTYPQKEIYRQKLIELIDIIYIRKKAHSLGKYVPPFINNYSKEKIYNDIIHFMHESELKELKQIKQFLKQKQL